MDSFVGMCVLDVCVVWYCVLLLMSMFRDGVMVGWGCLEPFFQTVSGFMVWDVCVPDTKTDKQVGTLPTRGWQDNRFNTCAPIEGHKRAPC
jgi:hypothetical protein